MTDDDILKSRFDDPEKPEKKPLPGAAHVESGFIDMVDRMIEGGMVLDRGGVTTEGSLSSASLPEKPAEAPAPEEKAPSKKPSDAA